MIMMMIVISLFSYIFIIYIVIIEIENWIEMKIIRRKSLFLSIIIILMTILFSMCVHITYMQIFSGIIKIYNRNDRYVYVSEYNSLEFEKDSMWLKETQLPVQCLSFHFFLVIFHVLLSCHIYHHHHWNNDNFFTTEKNFLKKIYTNLKKLMMINNEILKILNFFLFFGRRFWYIVWRI